jgi:hypothetical protein
MTFPLPNALDRHVNANQTVDLVSYWDVFSLAVEVFWP